MATPNHSSVYKQTILSPEESIARRRERLLTQQKLHRQNATDDHRNIQPLLDEITQTKRHKTNRKPYKNQLQLSEWLDERPDDFENWFMVGCPKGKRCLVVANKGITLVYGKNGGYMRKMHTLFPGDATNPPQATILDCVYDKEENVFWTLDVLAYGNITLTDCDVEFRFFWLSGRIEREGLDEIQAGHDAVFRNVRFADCSDQEAIGAMLGEFPMYADNRPEVDGLLFYHKESSYVAGRTPLVGWLYPFMVTEVLGIESVHPSWLAMRPDGYVDSKSYIKQFNAAMKKRNRYRRKPMLDMDVEEELTVNIDEEYENGSEMEAGDNVEAELHELEVQDEFNLELEQH